MSETLQQTSHVFAGVNACVSGFSSKNNASSTSLPSPSSEGIILAVVANGGRASRAFTADTNLLIMHVEEALSALLANWEKPYSPSSSSSSAASMADHHGGSGGGGFAAASAALSAQQLLASSVHLSAIFPSAAAAAAAAASSGALPSSSSSVGGSSTAAIMKEAIRQQGALAALTSPTNLKYTEALKRGIPVVRHQWVEWCVRHGKAVLPAIHKDIHDAAVSAVSSFAASATTTTSLSVNNIPPPLFIGPLLGEKVSTTGLSAPLTALTAHRVVYLGGIYSGRLDESVSVLLVDCLKTERVAVAANSALTREVTSYGLHETPKTRYAKDLATLHQQKQQQLQMGQGAGGYSHPSYSHPSSSASATASEAPIVMVAYQAVTEALRLPDEQRRVFLTTTTTASSSSTSNAKDGGAEGETSSSSHRQQQQLWTLKQALAVYSCDELSRRFANGSPPTPLVLPPNEAKRDVGAGVVSAAPTARTRAAEANMPPPPPLTNPSKKEKRSLKIEGVPDAVLITRIDDRMHGHDDDEDDDDIDEPAPRPAAGLASHRRTAEMVPSRDITATPPPSTSGGCNDAINTLMDRVDLTFGAVEERSRRVEPDAKGALIAVASHLDRQPTTVDVTAVAASTTDTMMGGQQHHQQQRLFFNCSGVRVWFIGLSRAQEDKARRQCLQLGITRLPILTASLVTHIVVGGSISAADDARLRQWVEAEAFPTNCVVSTQWLDLVGAGYAEEEEGEGEDEESEEHCSDDDVETTGFAEQKRRDHTEKSSSDSSSNGRRFTRIDQLDAVGVCRHMFTRIIAAAPSSSGGAIANNIVISSAANAQNTALLNASRGAAAAAASVTTTLATGKNVVVEVAAGMKTDRPTQSQQQQRTFRPPPPLLLPQQQQHNTNSIVSGAVQGVVVGEGNGVSPTSTSATSAFSSVPFGVTNTEDTCSPVTTDPPAPFPELLLADDGVTPIKRRAAEGPLRSVSRAASVQQHGGADASHTGVFSTPSKNSSRLGEKRLRSLTPSGKLHHNTNTNNTFSSTSSSAAPLVSPRRNLRSAAVNGTPRKMLSTSSSAPSDHLNAGLPSSFSSVATAPPSSSMMQLSSVNPLASSSALTASSKVARRVLSPATLSPTTAHAFASFGFPSSAAASSAPTSSKGTATSTTLLRPFSAANGITSMANASSSKANPSSVAGDTTIKSSSNSNKGQHHQEGVHANVPPIKSTTNDATTTAASSSLATATRQLLLRYTNPLPSKGDAEGGGGPLHCGGAGGGVDSDEAMSRQRLKSVRCNVFSPFAAVAPFSSSSSSPPSFLSLHLFALVDDSFTRAHRAVAKALLKLGGLPDEAIVRLPSLTPLLIADASFYHHNDGGGAVGDMLADGLHEWLEGNGKALASALASSSPPSSPSPLAINMSVTIHVIMPHYEEAEGELVTALSSSPSSALPLLPTSAIALKPIQINTTPDDVSYASPAPMTCMIAARIEASHYAPTEFIVGCLAAGRAANLASASSSPNDAFALTAPTSSRAEAVVSAVLRSHVFALLRAPPVNPLPSIPSLRGKTFYLFFIGHASSASSSSSLFSSSSALSACASFHQCVSRLISRHGGSTVDDYTVVAGEYGGGSSDGDAATREGQGVGVSGAVRTIRCDPLDTMLVTNVLCIDMRWLNSNASSLRGGGTEPLFLSSAMLNKYISFTPVASAVLSSASPPSSSTRAIRHSRGVERGGADGANAAHEGVGGKGGGIAIVDVPWLLTQTPQSSATRSSNRATKQLSLSPYGGDADSGGGLSASRATAVGGASSYRASDYSHSTAAGASTTIVMPRSTLLKTPAAADGASDGDTVAAATSGAKGGRFLVPSPPPQHFTPHLPPPPPMPTVEEEEEEGKGENSNATALMPPIVMDDEAISSRLDQSILNSGLKRVVERTKTKSSSSKRGREEVEDEGDPLPPSPPQRLIRIYIVSTVPDADALRAQIASLCEQHAQRLTTAAGGGGRAVSGSDCTTFAIASDVFYADAVVTNELSWRESVMMALCGGALLLKPTYVHACVREGSMLGLGDAATATSSSSSSLALSAFEWSEADAPPSSDGPKERSRFLEVMAAYRHWRRQSIIIPHQRQDGTGAKEVDATALGFANSKLVDSCSFDPAAASTSSSSLSPSPPFAGSAFILLTAAGSSNNSSSAHKKDNGELVNLLLQRGGGTVLGSIDVRRMATATTNTTAEHPSSAPEEATNQTVNKSSSRHLHLVLAGLISALLPPRQQGMVPSSSSSSLRQRKGSSSASSPQQSRNLPSLPADIKVVATSECLAVYSILIEEAMSVLSERAAAATEGPLLAADLASSPTAITAGKGGASRIGFDSNKSPSSYQLSVLSANYVLFVLSMKKGKAKVVMEGKALGTKAV